MQILWIFFGFEMELFLNISLFISPGCLNTKNCFPNCRIPLALSGKSFWLIFFLLSTQLILLSSGERVSVGVEPCGIC